MNLVVAAATEGGGAPMGQLAIITAFTTTIAAITALVAMSYRRGGAPRLRRFVAWVEGLVGLPGWAALPGIGAIVAAFVIITGATWDIGLHIDEGRDEGPLGTAAHYPLLLGLFGAFLMGILAIGLAPRQRKKNSPVAINVKGYGAVPAAALMLLAGSAFGMAAFPLDDLWHRIFGQDVTLWGPTHTMIIGGTVGAGIGGVLLLIEGALAAGRKPFGEGGLLVRPLPVLMAGVFLYFWAATTDEFNWGIQQYRQIWHPMLLSFGAAQALVLARILGGRGGAIGALLVWLPVQVAMSLIIGGPLEVTMPSTPLFLAEAIVIELIALTPLIRSRTKFGAAAGLGVGTIGFAATYGWTQIAMPKPWTTALLPEAIPVAIIAGVAGGVLSATMARALLGEISSENAKRSLWAGAVLPVAAFIALGFNAADTRTPEGVMATITTSNIREGSVPNHDEPQQVADVSVTLSDPSVADHPEWMVAMGWQGGGRYLNHLQRQADGSWKTTVPVPVEGRWKTMIRLHQDRNMMAAAIRFPKDPEIEFAGYALEPTVARPMINDHDLLQTERKDDGPTWAWRPASIIVLSLNLLMVVLLGFISYRIGRIPSQAARVETPSGSLIKLAAQARARATGLSGRGSNPGTA